MVLVLHFDLLEVPLGYQEICHFESVSIRPGAVLKT